MTPFELATRYAGVRELAGKADHPLIVWWLSLCFDGDMRRHDETPWCSAFMNGIAWELRLPRSYSAAARSWLNVGYPVQVEDLEVGWDVVVLWRGKRSGWQGHVALYAGWQGNRILLRGGNQRDAVTVAPYSKSRILGCRRLSVA